MENVVFIFSHISSWVLVNSLVTELLFLRKKLVVNVRRKFLKLLYYTFSLPVITDSYHLQVFQTGLLVLFEGKRRNVATDIELLFMTWFVLRDYCLRTVSIQTGRRLRKSNLFCYPRLINITICNNTDFHFTLQNIFKVYNSLSMYSLLTFYTLTLLLC